MIQTNRSEESCRTSEFGGGFSGDGTQGLRAIHALGTLHGELTNLIVDLERAVGELVGRVSARSNEAMPSRESSREI